MAGSCAVHARYTRRPRPAVVCGNEDHVLDLSLCHELLVTHVGQPIDAVLRNLNRIGFQPRHRSCFLCRCLFAAAAAAAAAAGRLLKRLLERKVSVISNTGGKIVLTLYYFG